MSWLVRSRGASAFGCVALLSGLLLINAGTALAADSRTVFFGSPTSANGALTFTDATTGGASAVDVLFRNDGKQTLNHVRITGGTQVPSTMNPRSAPSFCAVTNGVVTCPASLPSNYHYLAAYVSGTSTAAGTCALTDPASAGNWDGLDCSIGQVKAGRFVQVRVVVRPPATPGTGQLHFIAQLNEGSSGTGSNKDVFGARGDLIVRQGGCDSVAGYFLAQQAVDLANDSDGSCTSQKASIHGPSFDVQGAFASLAVGPGDLPCATSLSTFGGLVTAHVNNGAAPAGAIFTWTIRWDSSLYEDDPVGVVHCLDGGAVVPIYFNPAGQCATSTSTDCWTSFITTETYAEATFRTPTNGSSKGI